MHITYKLDLSRYTDNQVAMLMVTNIISREEFEAWRVNKQSPQTVTVRTPSSQQNPSSEVSA